MGGKEGKWERKGEKGRERERRKGKERKGKGKKREKKERKGKERKGKERGKKGGKGEKKERKGKERGKKGKKKGEAYIKLKFKFIFKILIKNPTFSIPSMKEEKKRRGKGEKDGKERGITGNNNRRG